MEKKLIKALITFLLFFSSCKLLDGNKEKEAFVEYVKAEVEGELWEVQDPRAGLVAIEGDSLVTMSANKFDSLRFPYNDGLHFSIFYETGKHQYRVIQKQEKHGRSTGFFYIESDGDATIAWYYPIQDSTQSSFSFFLKESEDGYSYIEGAFAFDVVVDSLFDNKEINKYRLRPDTFSVRNGKFRILLE